MLEFAPFSLLILLPIRVFQAGLIPADNFTLSFHFLSLAMVEERGAEKQREN